MSSVDPKRMAWAARRLTAVANAKTKEAADHRLFRLCGWAARSTQNMDAAFAATQMLRDLETIDRAEAAFVFNELFDSLLWAEMDDRTPDPELVRAIEEGVDLDLITAARSDQETVRTAAFHRDRGEEELADMVLHHADAYSDLRTEGEESLVIDKEWSQIPAPVRPPPTSPPALTEHVLALSATETFKEWMAAWPAFCKSLRGTDPASAVAAVQGLRDVGSISFNESLILIDMAIDDLVDEALAADREHHRLERAIDEFDRVHGIDVADGAAEESRPLARRVLMHRLNRRIDGIKAVVLRRFGEHRLANLQATQPEEYTRIRDELQVGLSGPDSPAEGQR
jgi:hypothetical protein